jgi:hypothetical protein
MLNLESRSGYQQVDLATASQTTSEHEEIRQAAAMHSAGFVCMMGGVTYTPDSVAATSILSANWSAKQFIADQASRKQRTYLGPSVTYGAETMTVYLSDSSAANVGLWVEPKVMLKKLKDIPFTLADELYWQEQRGQGSLAGSESIPMAVTEELSVID